MIGDKSQFHMIGDKSRLHSSTRIRPILNELLWALTSTINYQLPDQRRGGRGTLAWIVVPCWAFESIESIPLTSFIRSRMLTRPRPVPFIAVSGSKPTPESRTVRWIASVTPNSSTSELRAPLCAAELVKACCKTRKREREMSGGSGFGRSWLLKSISNFCRFPNSPQKPFMAVARSRYSSFGECSWCDKDWVSVAISRVSRCTSSMRLRTSAGNSEEFGRSCSSLMANNARR